jgi:hypothetical protein
MADKITVELASPDFNLPTANKTTIALYDDPGPLNGWEPLVAGDFTLEGKSTMVWSSAEKLINCRGLGVGAVLKLLDFDLDDPKVRLQGKAENQDTGNFPTGRCEWKITAVE